MSKNNSDLTVILADGSFPAGKEALEYLENARQVICCDGAARSLVAYGREPDRIVGDLDSLSAEFKRRFADRIEQVTEQESNDLSKAFRYCCQLGYNNIVILGATGKREDHTLGNLSLLSIYAESVPDIKIVTDYGYFTVAKRSGTLTSFPGQQISIVPLTGKAVVSASGLKYPMDKLELKLWYQATLNEALGDNFELDFPGNCELLIYRTFKSK
ncbi:MAG: thiamine diphosphokinase [Lentisphaeria bacterium]|nr:thiamine diphosphokinase [Lentisphaeria bacterium]